MTITRTLHEEAQFMITNDINGRERINKAKADGFDSTSVQAEIDKILCKDYTSHQTDDNFHQGGFF